MSEEGADYEKPTVAPSPSGGQSPRGILGNGNVVETGNGCIASNNVTVATNVTGSSGSGSTEVDESTRATAANAGTIPVAPMTSSSLSTSTPASAAAAAGSSSTWTAAPEIVSTTSASMSGVPTGSGSVSQTTLGRSGTKSSGNSSPRSPKLSRKSRVKLSQLQLESATREEWAAKWREQDLYVECLEAQAAAQEGELACLRDSEEKYRQQCFEVSHRERILVRRLASKEQQLLGYVNQITELRANQTPTASGLRSALLDPAVNILVQKLRQELLSTKAKLEDTQNELSAWKFTPDSNTGKRLMAKCRLLYQENEELGRMIASGRIAKLEGELVLQKSFSEEVKKSQSELDEFLQDLDEDVEGMQSTIYFLQQELRKARESVSLLQQENNAFKALSSNVSSPLPVPPQPPAQPPPPQPPPPPNDSNNLANGVVASSTPGVSKIEQSDVVEDSVEPSGNAKSLDSIKREISTDDDARCSVDESGNRKSFQTNAPTTSTSSPNETKSKSPQHDSAPRQIEEEPDESSNDSAALIIKVENEELSDREDEDEETTSNENRRIQRQTTRNVKDRTANKNDSVVGNRNGDDRTSSRRLLRERTVKRDKSATDSDEERHLHKKKRRESILSLDYTEADDDGLLLTNGESIQSDPEDGP